MKRIGFAFLFCVAFSGLLRANPAVSYWPDSFSARFSENGDLIQNLSETFQTTCQEQNVFFYSYDIDNDNDLDLVLAKAGSLEPIAVWINDGQNHFEKGGSWWCNQPIEKENLNGSFIGHQLQTDRRTAPDKIFSLPQRPLFCFKASPKIKSLVPSVSTFVFAEIHLPGFFPWQSSARSPPLSSIPS